MLENILNYIRIALYTLLIITGFFLFQAWQKDHIQYEPERLAHTEALPTTRPIPNTAMPSVAPAPSLAAPSTIVPPPPKTGQLINVKTDVLDVGIDTLGGDIVSVRLLDYPESLGSSSPFSLLNDDAASRYIAESGLLGKDGPDTTEGQALYTASQMNYTLAAGENNITVTLHWRNKNGISVDKMFTFSRNSYEIKVAYDINNGSTLPWKGSLYTQLMRTNTPPTNHGGLVNLATYFGAAISSPKTPFEKISFKQMKEAPLNQVIQGGWAAMIQHYFISAWIPPANSTSTYYSETMPNGLFAIGMIGQPVTVSPGTKVNVETQLYTGPAIADLLEKTAKGLKLTIDYGWFWFISDIIFWMMQKIYDVIGNWGWSIVIVTIIIKLLFYHLSAKSYRSMSGLKKLQPRIELLKERFGDDKQKLTQATLELYRAEKVNPMSGCLPILVQIPVFIALYWVLVESVQLRQAPWIFWIHDLSQQDPYYILPVLMGLSMFVQQRLNPPPPDPMQAKVMMLMPVIFTFLFANFPSGLMLYWFVNNTLSFLQQAYIMHRLDKETKLSR